MRIISAALAVSIIAIGAGFGIGYLFYGPKIGQLTSENIHLESEKTDLEMEVVRLSNDVENLNKQVALLSVNISELNQAISDGQNEITTLYTENTELKSEITLARSQIIEYKSKASSLQSDMISSKQRMDEILGITVNQYFSWTDWEWNMAIPISTYVDFLERPRPSTLDDYVYMAKDREDDYYISSLASGIKNATDGYNDISRLNWVAAFIQSLPYTSDNETTPYNEYPRYPIETLVDRGGDCEDTSILAASILNELGYDVALLLLSDAQHMAVGVNIPGAYGSYYKFDEKRYFYLETTGEGWRIGQIPPNITLTTAKIYPITS